MVQLASHRTFFSSSCRITSWSALVLVSVPITGHLFRLARPRGPQHQNSEARYMCSECAVKLLGPGSSHRYLKAKAPTARAGRRRADRPCEARAGASTALETAWGA